MYMAETRKKGRPPPPTVGSYRLFSFRIPNTFRKSGASRAGECRTTIFMCDTFLSM